jgi:hypothetical protein
MTFSVVIDDPYAQTYTVEWERIYNGVPTPITPDTEVSYSFAPTFLAAQVGIHIISVKVKDTSNKIVDSHNFQLVINENPKPVIQSASVTPALYASSYTPTQLPQNFLFTIYNNGAVTLGAGYRTDWKLYRSGLLIDSETDTFTSTSSGGYNYPSYAFDPVLIDSIAVGAYTIIARVTNTAAEVVAEQQWSATVAHPALSKVTKRDIYSSSTSPSFSAITTAYDSVAYTASTTYNFIPAGGLPILTPAQGDYCVTIASGEGTYSGDSLFVRVDYYLDGASSIYSGTTTAIDNKICLSDAAAATLNGVIFSNTSSTTTQTHTLVAKVTDEATGFEYALSDMNGSLGSYPITWNFSVKPQNQAPTVAFGTMTAMTCATTSGTSKTGCTTTSDTNFKVRIALSSLTTGDDFYDSPADDAQFDYSIRLYQDGVNIQTCTKAGYSVADPYLLASPDLVGNDGYECELRINSFNGSGPLALNTHVYSIQAEISDSGSPIAPGIPMSSTTRTWSFSSVTETETVPTIASWSVGDATEGTVAALPISFYAEITDAELDNHTWKIKYCIDVGCTTETELTSGIITRTTSTNPYILSFDYNLLEDFLLNLTGLGCDATLRNATCAVTFKLYVTDVPTTATGLAATSITDSSTITNYNPLPVLNTAGSTPSPATYNALTPYAFVGNPVTIGNIFASILTDSSAVATEKTFRYQWYAINNGSVVLQWEPIVGATSLNLIWTPSHIDELNVIADQNMSFMLCAEDQPAAAVPTVSPTFNGGVSICNDATPWNVKVNNNIAVVHDLSSESGSPELATLAGDDGVETAIWYDTPSTFNSVTSSAAYIASIGNDQRIYVKKVLVRDGTGIDKISTTEIVSFNAVPTGTLVDVKNLSITGTSTELYIAYLASRTGSPFSFYPQVRRIDLTLTSGKLVPNNHAGKFGFDYDGLGFVNNCLPTSTDCTATATSAVSSIVINPSGGSMTVGSGFTLQTPNGNVAFTFGTYDGVSNIMCSTCSGITMATNLVTLINQSTDPLLAGYSASNVAGTSNTVTINGASTLDYFDASPPTTNARMADQLGKIYIHAGSWYLPFINTSLGGASNDKLSFYHSTTGAHMNVPAEALKEPSDLAGLTTMDAALKFDSYYDGSKLWIAIVSKTGSAGRLYKVDPSSYAIAAGDSLNIMSGLALLDIQVAGSTTFGWVAATTAVSTNYRMGVYDINVDLQDEFDINDSANLDASSDTDNYFNYASISSLKIVPYLNEARLFAVSQGTPVSGTYRLYMARLRTVSSVWTLSCGDCKTISETSASYDISEFVGLGVAPIRIDPGNDPLYKLSTAGNTPFQGIKDTAFVSFGRSVASATDCDPAIGVFNVEGENIEATSIFSGTAPNEDAGLFRPPFVKN